VARTVIPFGPQHPVLPEPVQLTLTCEDDRVVDVAPVIGYCHRGIEKGAERNGIHQNVFLVERICSFIHAQCYCQALEELTEEVIHDPFHCIYCHFCAEGCWKGAIKAANVYFKPSLDKETTCYRAAAPEQGFARAQTAAGFGHKR